jgi:hypothetical protein
MAVAEPDTEIVMEVAPGSRRMPEELVRLPSMERWRLEYSFVQRSRIKGYSRSFALFNGHFLEVREGRKGQQRRAVFNLAFLESAPVPNRVIAWRWIVLTLMGLCAGIGAMATGLLLVGSGILAVGVLTAFQALRRSCYQWVFYTHLGRVPVFVLEPGWSAQLETRQFADLVSQRTEGAHWLLPEGRDRLAAIMAEHRRLHDSGSVSTRCYERARQRIMNRFSRV